MLCWFFHSLIFKRYYARSRIKMKVCIFPLHKHAKCFPLEQRLHLCNGWMFFFHLSLCIINYLHKQNAVCYCCVGNMNLKCRAVGGNDDFFFSPTKQRARMYGMFIIYIGDITRRGKKHLSKVFYTSTFMKQGCVTVRWDVNDKNCDKWNDNTKIYK